jgi:hypothetical protein
MDITRYVINIEVNEKRHRRSLKKKGVADVESKDIGTLVEDEISSLCKGGITLKSIRKLPYYEEGYGPDEDDYDMEV